MPLFATRNSRLLPLIVVSALPMLAQGVSTQLSGVVTSKDGSPVEGAAVQVRNTETGLTRVVRTDAKGRYLAPILPVGPYSVTITKEGFQAASNLKVNLNLGDGAPLNVRLAGVASAIVEVTATPAAMDSDRTTVATLISPDNLTTLPSFNRSFTSLATLAPQVTVDSSRGNLAIGGQRGINTSINIDGGDNNEPFFGGAVGGAEGKTPFTVSIEAIREYQVITDGASAEFGRMGGGYVNAITKSGSNEILGSAFYYTRPKSMVATNPEGLQGHVVGDFKQDQFGFTLGGPIIKDKLFYFVAYDGQRRTDPIEMVWGGTKPATLDPTQAGQANDQALLNRSGNYDTRANSDVVFLRFDYNPTSDHSIQLRTNYSNFKGDAYSGMTSAYENTVSDDIKTLAVVAQWNWNIAPSWLNEVRVNYIKDEMPRHTRANGPQVNISTPNYTFGYYGSNPYPREYETKRIQITEGLTYATTTMQVKAGFDFNRISVSEIFSSFYQGEYRFDDLAQFRLGNWSQYQQRFSLLPGVNAWDAGKFDADEDQLAAYVQADFRFFNTLKVGVGVRWDRQTHPSFGIADVSSPLAATFPLSAKIPTDSQFSPRLSFTWTPDFDGGRTVLRGSIGRYVSTTPSVFLYQAYTVNGVRMAQVSFKANQAATYGIPIGTAFDAQAPFSFAGMPGGATAPKSDIFTFDPNFRNPHTDRVNLGVERAFLGGDLVLGLNGSYARSKDLERLRDINLGTPAPVILAAQNLTNPVYAFPAQTLSSGRLSFGARPNTNFGKVMVYTSDADGIYHAYTFTAKYQPANKPFQAQVNYTYAIDKDNDANERNFSSYSTQNTQNLGDEWGYSDRDRRHVVTGWASYLEPFSKIQIGLSFRYLSGSPYSLTLSGDQNGDGISGNDRYIPVISATNGVVSAWGTPTVRNDYRASSQMTFDLKLSRDFPLPFGKHTKFGVSAEVFNLLNRHDTYSQNYIGVNPAYDSRLKLNDATAALRSRPGIVGSPRQVQLGARLTF